MTREAQRRRCSARSSRTGQPCRSWAILGGTVCVNHGGRAPQVVAAAKRRLAMAEVLEQSPRREPVQVLLDAVHLLDVRARQMKDTARSAEEVEALIVASTQAAVMAKQALTPEVLGLLKREETARRSVVESEGRELAAVARDVARALGHDPETDAFAREVIAWAFRAAGARHVGKPEPAPPRRDPSGPLEGRVLSPRQVASMPALPAAGAS